jgi:hypothetical protein
MTSKLLIEPQVGPCSSSREIEEWIDTLLDLRSEMGGFAPALDEISYHLGVALGWLAVQRAGARCA